MGQREAAETTRIKFGLKTFSHSTLCRTFKDLEQSLEKRFGKRIETQSEETATVDEGVERTDATTTKRQFPSVMDTAERRMIIRKFLCEFRDTIKEGDIAVAGCNVIRCWYDVTKQLLI
jgi:hypothetical protein